MKADWNLYLGIAAALIVIIINIIHFSMRGKSAGGRSFIFLILVILITAAGIIGGNYILGLPQKALDRVINDYDQAIRRNDSLGDLVEDLRISTDSLREGLDELQRINDSLKEDINRRRPRLVFAGDSTRLAGVGDSIYYYTTYFFRASNAAVEDVEIKIDLTGEPMDITCRVRGPASDQNGCQIRINGDMRGFTCRKVFLPQGSYLLIVVKSEDMLETVSISWSPA